MRRILPVAVLAVAALAAAACEKPGTKSAYLNSGADATPAMAAVETQSKWGAAPAEPAKPEAGRDASSAPAVSDTASPSPAATPSR